VSINRNARETDWRELEEKEPIKFTIDSALLRELGERLVGQPHIALAELVKNSYDADARKVEIRLFPDRIEVSDNGHGMSFAEFKNFWMRIGTPHKQKQSVSRRFYRPLTGSKGVGRLAVQFLAREIEIRTVAETQVDEELDAWIDWDQAVPTEELIEAEAFYFKTPRQEKFPNGSEHGTTIILTKLNQEWTTDNIAGLAREIWSLQPPFRSNPRVDIDQSKDFVIDLQSDDPQKVEEFESRMKAYLGLWDTKLVGELIERDISNPENPIGRIRLSLEFSDQPGEVKNEEYNAENCPLHFTEFEIRVYSLTGRQKYGVKVGDARDYFKEFGGIHIYDAGFHLPYYGPDTDWLGIEMDHSHRLSESKLLPKNFQIKRGLNNLPTTSRLFGIVHVDTALERIEAPPTSTGRPPEYLEIQVTRDRLVDNRAFSSLRDIVRWALDYYAMEQTRRKLAETETKRPIEPTSKKVENLESVLDHFEAQMPPHAFMELRSRVREAAEASQTEAEIAAQQIGLLAPLATAGMCALAYEHEVGKQFRSLESVAIRLGKIFVADLAVRQELDSIRTSLETWIVRAKGTRALFSHLTSSEHNEKRQRFKGKALLEMVKEQLRPLTRDLFIDTSGIESDAWLPEGSFSEWSALFQNVLINASNALLDSDQKRLLIRSIKLGTERRIRIEDTGAGVNLASSGELFEPFVRRLEISQPRRALGLGGSGLGLTIVRMIAENVGCRVGFVEPSPGFSTCFELAWKESK
jgi:signal transduction histidine kinase